MECVRNLETASVGTVVTRRLTVIDICTIFIKYREFSSKLLVRSYNFLLNSKCYIFKLRLNQAQWSKIKLLSLVHKRRSTQTSRRQNVLVPKRIGNWTSAHERVDQRYWLLLVALIVNGWASGGCWVGGASGWRSKGCWPSVRFPNWQFVVAFGKMRLFFVATKQSIRCGGPALRKTWKQNL